MLTMADYSFLRLLLAIGSGLRCRGEKHDPLPDLLTSSALAGSFREADIWAADTGRFGNWSVDAGILYASNSALTMP
jgi:hypothetical protein